MKRSLFFGEYKNRWFVAPQAGSKYSDKYVIKNHFDEGTFGALVIEHLQPAFDPYPGSLEAWKAFLHDIGRVSNRAFVRDAHQVRIVSNSDGLAAVVPLIRSNDGFNFDPDNQVELDLDVGAEEVGKVISRMVRSAC